MVLCHNVYYEERDKALPSLQHLTEAVSEFDLPQTGSPSSCDARFSPASRHQCSPVDWDELERKDPEIHFKLAGARHLLEVLESGSLREPELPLHREGATKEIHM